MAHPVTVEFNSLLEFGIIGPGVQLSFPLIYWVETVA